MAKEEFENISSLNSVLSNQPFAGSNEDRSRWHPPAVGKFKANCDVAIRTGEALACRLACQLAKSYNLLDVVIEGDNQSVIQLSVSETDPPWDCATIFFDIKMLATQGNFVFSWTRRSANRAVHWVAQAHLRGHLPLDWVSVFPHSLAVLLEDC
ncbi:hypothetical protein ACSBR1_004766 [Camellia fascicularis]